jgi:DNA-binding MurR/RpiR family transcriptional regulator
MGFRAVVASTNLSLTNSEQRVLKVLLGDEDVSSVTAAVVGERARTHESTVIRLARKLGYRGYPELRADLNKDLELPAPRKVMRSESGWSLASLARDEARALERLSSFISQDDLDAAAATIDGANRVYLLGNTDSPPVLQVLDRRLRRLGMDVIVMLGGPKDLAERFTSFDGHSVLIAFALRETPRHLERVVGEAGRRGGKSVLITDVPGVGFRPPPDHVLAAPRSADAEYNTLLVPMTLCYALQLAIFHRDVARFQRFRDDIDDLTRMAGGPDEIPLRS